MGMETCERCGDSIDKGACGRAFSIITVKDDRENDADKYQQRRFYLCDDCTFDLEIRFIADFKIKFGVK